MKTIHVDNYNWQDDWVWDDEDSSYYNERDDIELRVVDRIRWHQPNSEDEDVGDEVIARCPSIEVNSGCSNIAIPVAVLVDMLRRIG